MSPRYWIIESNAELGRLAGYLARLSEHPPELAQPLRVTIEPYKKQRTVPQNARLWKLHTMASEVTGYTPEEMHEEALCHHFGFTEKQVKCLITGQMENRRVPLKRSSARDTKEFSEFMEATERWYAQELGVWLGE